MTKKLHIILWDQLSFYNKIFDSFDKKNDLIFMCETKDLATYVKHHQKKLVFLFSCMRHFKEELEDKGFNVEYILLDQNNNSHSFDTEIKKAIEKHDIKEIVYTEASEYFMQQKLSSIDIKQSVKKDFRFISTRQDFAEWAEPYKNLRMENFYRMDRKKHTILMDGDQPEGGKWNYDQENRKFPKEKLDIPNSYQSHPDDITEEVIKLVEKHFSEHFGNINDIYFAMTHEQAVYVLDKFISERLSQFGDFQDAMIQNEPWMYHSHLSFYINNGLLDPMHCIKKAEEAYYDGKAPLNAVEGFIRQILGWREYVNGIYWLKMPSYESVNHLNATRNLPWFFWTGTTKMNCLHQCIQETKENAYAHHIQRLMVLGNFCLIAGIDPKEVNEWYWIVYADAYQWVELPNVSGMILYADGGYLASKPYAASGSYINKMSNYCKTCHYKVSKKNGSDACPFNYLYWNFMIEHKEKFRSNHRMGMIYNILSKMDDEKIKLIESDSNRFFKALKDD